MYQTQDISSRDVLLSSHLSTYRQCLEVHWPRWWHSSKIAFPTDSCLGFRQHCRRKYCESTVSSLKASLGLCLLYFHSCVHLRLSSSSLCQIVYQSCCLWQGTRWCVCVLVWQGTMWCVSAYVTGYQVMVVLYITGYLVTVMVCA